MRIYLQTKRCRNRALMLAALMTSVFVAEGKGNFPGASAAVLSTTGSNVGGNIEAVALQQVVYKGVVRDAKGEALPGVSVRIKGSTKGTSTDHNGRFNISASSGNILVLSFVGYQSKEVTLGSSANLSITLSDDAQSLNEVVVTSMGIKREAKSLGYAVSTVSAKELTQAGNTNFASALYGKAAGVKITTAPGGASSAVNVQIRGINSLSYNQQPLYVVDGIVIRNDGQFGAGGANNNNFWDDQRIRGNGVLDINPQDIESLSVLKGASATALYGSDAASGVIVITTKKGLKGRGMGIDFNYQGSMDNAAFLPKYQNIYGPGYDRELNATVGANAEGWISDANSPSGRRPNYRAYANFGPKMNGEQILWWDGSVRNYDPQPNNYRDIYQQGYTSNASVSLSKMTENLNYRLSATRLDVNGTQPGNELHKNTFSLNSNVKLSKNVNTDIIVNYINTQNVNRPYQLGQVLGSYGGFFNRSEDMSIFKNRYQTPNGYKYALFNATNRDERFLYAMRGENLLDFFWQQMKNNYTENENRLISSATLNWDVINHLKFRGRIGTDYTGVSSQTKQHNEQPIKANSPTSSTGGYSTTKGQYGILYGDLLLTYDNSVGKDWKFSVSGGYQGRSEKYNDQSSSTTNGLVTENWFSLNNSYGILGTTESRKELIKYAFLGIGNISFKDFLFIEGTARQEYASSLPVKNNSYFYPSVNASFVFTDAFKIQGPLNYGKLRASYGVVGNAPPMYESNIAFNNGSLQTINGSVTQVRPSRSYGNNELKPEMKREVEFGLETRFFNSRVGFDVSYYNNRVKDQILQLPITSTTGALSQISNIGEIGSQGFEMAITASPIVKGNLRWDTRFNLSFNRSKVISLSEQVGSELISYLGDQNSSKISSAPGERLGSVYAYKRLTDDKGNFVIDDNGLYVMTNEYEYLGNIMPDLIGGFSNTFTYKSLSLDFNIDYRIGGKMLSPSTKFMMGAGMFENTLAGRDAEHGGLQYTDNGVTYNDGILLNGVNQTTGQANTKVVDAASYYFNTFQWGANSWNGGSAIFDNSFIKMREVTLAYRVPEKFASKLKMSNLRVSLIGRNLFYLYRTSKNVDPEAPIGTRWWSQGVDVGSTAASRTFGFSITTSF